MNSTQRKQSVIFLGDIAIPSNVTADIDHSSHFNEAIVVANIEGDIVSNDSNYYSQNLLFNHTSIFEFLEKLNVCVANLANNHILDIHSTVSETGLHLKKEGIMSVGAGDNIGQASQIQLFENGDDSYAILSFGWKIIGAQPAGVDSPGVNPLVTDYVLKMIEYAGNTYSDRKIIVQFHWNYNLELHPQPMHRKLAFQAAERGADIIVGHHPHIVSGIEVHDSTPILYSLGNWFIPHGVYFDGELSYPEISTLHLAAEWSLSERLLCHWYRYRSDDHSLNYIESEPFSDSERIEQLTPYQGMSHTEYTEWFRKNRRVRSFLPVYVDPEQHSVNKLKDFYCECRQTLVDKYSEILQ